MQETLLNPSDRTVFARELDDFLPERIVDVHTHIWEGSLGNSDSDNSRVVTWPGRVAAENTLPQLMDIYGEMFPGRTVVPIVFANVVGEESLPKANMYVAGAAQSIPALRMTPPSADSTELAASLNGQPFCGIKVYLTYSPANIPANEIEIFDFLSREHLDVANRLGAMVMLHIPRGLRLRDPVNVSQMLEIDRNYSQAKVVIAHVGRAYCPDDLGDAMEQLSKSKNLLFDISANTCSDVFEELLKAVGPERVLFGSDLPITTMRMRRICEGGRYVNVVPDGLYGDVSGDPNMREVGGEEAARLTLFLYEELLALKGAVTRLGLGEHAVRLILHQNAERVIASTPYGPLQ